MADSERPEPEPRARGLGPWHVAAIVLVDLALLCAAVWSVGRLFARREPTAVARHAPSPQASASQAQPRAAAPETKARPAAEAELQAGRLGPTLPVPQANGSTQPMPAGVVCDVAYTPDGRLLAVAHSYGVDLWDTSLWRITRRLDGHTQTLAKIAISPKGRWLATASADGTIGLWNLATGRMQRRIQAHKGGVSCVAFSADRATLVSAGEWDGFVRLWDVATGAERGKIEDAGHGIYAVAVSPDGRWIALSDSEETVQIWDAASLQCVKRMDSDRGYVSSLDFSADGRRLAAGCCAGVVKVWLCEGWRVERTIAGHVGPVYCVRFSPDSQRLASGSRVCLIHETNPWYERVRIEQPEGVVVSLAFHPLSRRLALGSTAGDGAVREHEVSAGVELERLPTYGEELASLALQPADSPKQLVVVHADGEAHVLDLASGRDRPAFHMPGGEPQVRFAPDGAHVVTAGSRGFPKLWDIATGKPTQIFIGHDENSTRVCFSPDGQRILTGARDKTARLWDAATGRQMRCLRGHADAVIAVAYSPDGRRVASASAGVDNTVRVWDVLTGKQVASVEPPDGAAPRGVAFIGRGESIVVGDSAGRLTLWDVETSELKAQVQAHAKHPGITALAVSPTAPVLASGGGEGLIHIWYAPTLELVHTLRGHRFVVADLSFSSNGALLASCGWDGMIYLWNITSPRR